MTFFYFYYTRLIWTRRNYLALRLAELFVSAVEVFLMSDLSAHINTGVSWKLFDINTNFLILKVSVSGMSIALIPPHSLRLIIINWNPTIVSIDFYDCLAWRRTRSPKWTKDRSIRRENISRRTSRNVKAASFIRWWWIMIPQKPLIKAPLRSPNRPSKPASGRCSFRVWRSTFTWKSGNSTGVEGWLPVLLETAW